jgi:phospholipid/cholesterol/gamma-HCH transport system substrate-binding protein
MTTSIRKHLRDVVAIVVLVLVAVVTTVIILQQQRLRIPILEDKPFELKAEFSSAQAVVPGQGQTINVAGVTVGQVADVELVEGRAVVTFDVERQYLPIYRNATILLRPRTGLKDMYFQLDPGTKSAGEVPDGGTVPVSNTAPDVNLDEILSALDADTQAYLRLLLIGGGQGLKGQGKNLGEILGSLGPLNRDLEKLNSMVSQRRQELAHLIHNLSVLTKEIGDNRGDIVSFVQANNDALSAIGGQDPDLQRALAQLPGTLRTGTRTFQQVRGFAHELGPTFNSLRPFARHLDAMNASVRDVAEATTPAIRGQIRPFVRAARPEIPPLRRGAARFARTAPPLTTDGRKLNHLFNLLAYNPRGGEPPGTPGRDEGYLYWLGWLGHLAGREFSTQDAHGSFRRAYLTAGCRTIRSLVAQDPSGGVISGLIQLVTPGAACAPTPGGQG